MVINDPDRSQRHADTLKRLGLDPIAKQAATPAEAENSPAQLPKLGDLRNLDDWQRALAPNVVTDDGSAKPGDQIRSIDDFRRIGDQLTRGALAKPDAAKLTGNDWKILKGLLPPDRQPDPTIAINRAPTPWRQKIRPLGRHVFTEPEESIARLEGDQLAEDQVSADGEIRELPRLGDTLEASADTDDIREVRLPGPAVDPYKPAMVDDSSAFGQNVGAQAAGASNSIVADAMKVRASDYQKQYPPAKMQETSQRLAKEVPNWDKLDYSTRNVLTHLAVDIGVDKVLANDPLVNGIENGNHTVMADALQRFDGRTTQDKLDSYTAGLKSLATADKKLADGTAGGDIDVGFVAHTVQRGQSLSKLAKAYGVTPDAIIEANPEVIKNGELYYDTHIIIPSPTKKPDIPGRPLQSDISFQDKVASTLVIHEEFRPEAYPDTNSEKANITVGYGFNMDRGGDVREVWAEVLPERAGDFDEVKNEGGTITETEAKRLRDYDIDAHTKIAKDVVDRNRTSGQSFNERSEIERIAIVNFIYMGGAAFPKAITALQEGDYRGVAKEMRESQTYDKGDRRIRELINIFTALADAQEAKAGAGPTNRGTD